MELARLIDAVERVRATTKKSEKVRVLAEALRETHGDETKVAALYLSGSLPQGKIGVGWNITEAFRLSVESFVLISRESIEETP